MRVAVVGAGVMGSNHGRILATIPGVEMTHVVDHDVERATALAGASGARAVGSVDEILGQVDAAIIALPTELHVAAAVPLLRSGVPCLVEKPIATDLAGAREILDAAVAGDTTVMIGHVERFNPAVQEMLPLLDDVIHVEATRMGPFTARVSDSIVIDLMIHDLDLVRMIAGADPVSTQAVTRQEKGPSPDLAVALIEFANGITATITASRLGQQKVRLLEVTQRDSFVSVDLLRTDVLVNRVEHAEYVGEEGTRYRQRGVVEIPMIQHRGEPLALEQREFFASIREHRPPAVTGEDGARALAMALSVLAAGEGRDLEAPEQRGP